MHTPDIEREILRTEHPIERVLSVAEAVMVAYHRHIRQTAAP